MTPDLLSSLNKSGSGLNLRELAQTLATSETAPRIIREQRAQETDNLRLSGLAQVRAQFDALGGALVQAASNPVLTVQTNTPAVLPKVTDRSALTTGSVFLDVTALAKPQVLEFANFTSPTDVFGGGSLTVEFGTWSDTDFAVNPDTASRTVNIAAGTTLTELAETLNRLPGITAQILDKGDGTVSLGVLTETGAQNAVRFTAQDTGGAGVSLAALDTVNDNAAKQVQASQDARFTVNGIAVTRPSNQVNDILPGVEVSLLAPTTATLGVERSQTAAQQNMQSLVNGLNDTLKLLRDLTRTGVGDGTAGELAGDRSLQSVEAALRRLISEPINGFSDRPISLADLGIATERSGSLRFDMPAFDRTFAARAADFDALFDNKLRALSGQSEVTGTTSLSMQSGDYAFKRDATGLATLDGFRMSSFAMPDGRVRHTAVDGPARGLAITTPADLTSDTIRFGRSFAESLAIMLDNAVSANGAVQRRETEIDRQNTQRSERITLLESRAAIAEKRYLSRFAAMEQAISQMNSTSSYLKNLVDIWSNQK
jgi:flagellar hook-associated protein 2